MIFEVKQPTMSDIERSVASQPERSHVYIPAVEDFATLRAIASSCIDLVQVAPSVEGATVLRPRPEGLDAAEMLANVIDLEVDNIVREARNSAWWETDEPKSNPYKEYGLPREEFVFANEATGRTITLHNFRPTDIDPKEIEDVEYVLDSLHQVTGPFAADIVSDIVLMPNDGRDYAATTQPKPRIDINQPHAEILTSDGILGRANELELDDQERATQAELHQLLPGWSQTGILLAHELGHRAYDHLYAIYGDKYDVFLQNTGPAAYPLAYVDGDHYTEEDSSPDLSAVTANQTVRYAKNDSAAATSVVEMQSEVPLVTAPETRIASEKAIEGACENFMLLLLDPEKGDRVRSDATITMLHGLNEGRSPSVGIKFSDGTSVRSTPPLTNERRTGDSIELPTLALPRKIVAFAIME